MTPELERRAKPSAATTRKHELEMEEIAERAAKLAIHEFFIQLGFDTTEPANVLELQADFRHMRYMRTLSSHVGKKMFVVTLQLVIGGFILWLWLRAGLPIPAGIHLGD